MKKIFYVLIAILTFALSGCNDDSSHDDDYSKSISKIYRDNDLKIILNGKELKNKVVKFQTNNIQTADVMVRYTIPGEDSLLVTSVRMSQVLVNGNIPKYEFTGENINSERSIQINGQIDSVLTININFEIKSQIIGKWTTSKNSDNVPISIKLVPQNENDSINMFGILGHQKIPLQAQSGTNTTDFANVVADFGSLLFSLIQVELTLDKNSELITSWKPLLSLIPIQPGESDKDKAHYNTKNGYLYAAIAVDSILIDATTTKAESSDYLALLDLAQKAYKGLPFKLEYLNNDLITISANREMMQPYVKPILNVLKPEIADLDLGSVGATFGVTKDNLVLFIDEFTRVVDESKEFELTFCFQRTTK